MSGTSNPPLALQQAAPLAGGPAAAGGGQFMDVQGNSIVLPASYCPPGPGGGYGPGGPGGGGYGDPMAVDFGGYGSDQSGPHYFDVALDTVFLQRDSFEGAGPTISAGASANIDQGNRLNVLSGREEYEPGWRIAARYDLGPLSVIEGTYMGVYDMGFNGSITSEQASVAVGLPPLANFLFTAPTFGIPVPIATLDAASLYTINYESDLQSTEISYRRYWMGYNSRVTGTFLLGARYLRMTEGFAFNTVTGLGNAALNSSSENDLVGFQFGGDGWLTLRQGLRIGTEMKAGVYNNRFKLRNTGVFAQVSNSPADFDVESEGNQVAFAAEGGVTMVADILPSWSIRGGYQVMYLSSLAAIDAANPLGVSTRTQADALYHGFHGGLEYVW
ncbi:MAG: hypothetical protein GXP28_11280 [Planctomycetes bacterium]|nr:hypothetical protein [Planctomycetota bacterium]